MKKNSQNLLLQWFMKNKRDMPWREDPTPYRVWISEIMLQQTTVATVRSFYLRFMDRFPNLEELSHTDEDEILKYWAGLGYYSRARNILKTAKILKSESAFPSDFLELKKLPGIGSYTAAAIASLAFNKPVALVDTNVDRVLGRFYALNRKDRDFNKVLQNFAQGLIENVSKENIWAWNQAVMELGALVCGVKKTQCDQCPLMSECQALQSGDPLQFPGDKIKSQIKHVIEYAYILKQEGKYLLSKITKGSRRIGLYDFPIGDHQSGQEIYRINYRISNNKVERICCLIGHCEYKIQENDRFVFLEDILENYALTSPCKKFLEHQRKTVRKND